AQELGLSDCKKIVQTGPAKKLIVKAVKENNVDLVIMGTHGETGIGRLLGSTANAVVQRVKCDVLVVHKDPSA
ncbi:MAG: universal stress protein, partial [Arenicellales bacterium]